MANLGRSISRRRALAIGGGLAGSLLVAGSSHRVPAVYADVDGDSDSFSANTIKQMEAILQTNGTQSNGVLSFELDRNDFQGYTLGGHTLPTPIPYKPSWQNNGQFYFQALAGGRAILNGDFGGMLPEETDPFIDQLLQHGLVFQAFHQHFTDIHPNQLYYMHFRGVGDPLVLAQGVIAAVKATKTPLPQFQSSTPTTPLPTNQLASILGGPATVGQDGVVTVDVPRRDQINLGGVRINPFLNIATSVGFEPLNSSGSTVAVAPDFSMIASEIQNVMKVMRQQGWVVGCLYNQETDEQPQLYFSHQVKVGDPITLAHEVRMGLNQMNTVGS